jgi:hypothetical protein
MHVCECTEGKSLETFSSFKKRMHPRNPKGKAEFGSMNIFQRFWDTFTV